jgi:hypothetical protein
MIGARRVLAGCAVALVVGTAALRAHDGPPFPIVSNQPAGAYVVSVWTDPDTTDDGSPGGQFWVLLAPASKAAKLPEGTIATVTVKPLDRTGSEHSAAAGPVRGDITNQFAAVLMDHEGRFAVHVRIDGPLGPASVDAAVDATYDLRPPPGMLILYLAPFVAVAVLWARLLIRRRSAVAKDSGNGDGR